MFTDFLLLNQIIKQYLLLWVNAKYIILLYILNYNSYYINHVNLVHKSYTIYVELSINR